MLLLLFLNKIKKNISDLKLLLKKEPNYTLLYLKIEQNFFFFLKYKIYSFFF
jgi:hypothetical protein